MSLIVQTLQIGHEWVAT